MEKPFVKRGTITRYVCRSYGEIIILRKDVHGTPRELATLSPPSMIGQMGLVDGSARSATCVAKGNVESLSISQKYLRKFLKKLRVAGSAFRHLLLASMTNRLATANDKIRGLISDMEKEQEEEKTKMAEWRKKSVQRVNQKKVHQRDCLKLQVSWMDGMLTVMVSTI